MPVDVTENYIRIRVKDPGAFEEDSFRTIALSEEEGIKAVVGKLSGESKTTVQSYLFDKEKWDEEKAKAWVEEHQEGKAAIAEFLLALAYEARGKRERPQPAQAAGGQGPESLAVKMLSQDDLGATVGGYLLLYGDADHRDLQRQFFTAKSELWLDKYPKVPALFHHGLDPAVGLSVVGHRLSAKTDDKGAWVKHWIDKSNAYWDWIEPLLEAGRLFYSPGSANHLVRADAKTGEIFSYPVIEDTMTPIPAQPRLRPVEELKAAYKSANLAFPELDGDSPEEELCLAQEQTEALRLRLRMELLKL